MSLALKMFWPYCIRDDAFEPHAVGEVNGEVQVDELINFFVSFEVTPLFFLCIVACLSILRLM